MKRRELIKWTAPTVVAVTLPVHATTSDFGPIVTTTPAPSTTIITTPGPPVTPYPTLPPKYCATGYVKMCKSNTTGLYNTVCVAPSDVTHYESLGYTIGECQPKK